jgi:hypothetical protein
VRRTTGTAGPDDLAIAVALLRATDRELVIHRRDTTNIRTFARKDGDSYVVTGHKNWLWPR